MAHKLVLYHYWRSSASWRVRWALALKGLSYESVMINLLNGDQARPEFLGKNPSGFIPCLEIDGKPLGESMAIIEWLEETYPQVPLLPQAPFERAQVRNFSLNIVAGIAPLQNISPQKYLSSDPAVQKAWTQHWIKRGLLGCEAMLRRSAGTYAFGGSVTMADLCLIPQFYNAIRFEADTAELPLCRGIYERCIKTTACDQAAPQNQPGATK